MRHFIILIILVFPLTSMAQLYGDCISGDCENGYGTWHSSTTIKGYNDTDLIETKYTGEFKDGKFHGLGTLSYFSKEEEELYTYKYEGSFELGKVNGYCVTTKIHTYGYIWRFCGQYQNDKRNGVGIFYPGERGIIQESGSVGYWVNGKFIKEIAEF